MGLAGGAKAASRLLLFFTFLHSTMNSNAPTLGEGRSDCPLLETSQRLPGIWAQKALGPISPWLKIWKARKAGSAAMDWDGAQGGQGGGLGQMGRARGWAHFLWLQSQSSELVNGQVKPIPQHRPSLRLGTHPGPPASVHRSSSPTLCTPPFKDHPDTLKPSVTEEAEVRGH